jgi:hypothetical protein
LQKEERQVQQQKISANEFLANCIVYIFVVFFAPVLVSEEKVDDLSFQHARSELDLTEHTPTAAFTWLPEVLAPDSLVVAALPHTFPAIDAAGPGRRVFQITINKNHTLPEKNTVKILKSAGFLNSEGKHTDDCSREVLEFYWMVLPEQYSDWSKMLALSYPNTDEVDAKYCWDNYVVQYVLELSRVGPIYPATKKTTDP